jgi:hypothetical protein
VSKPLVTLAAVLLMDADKLLGLAASETIVGNTLLKAGMLPVEAASFWCSTVFLGLENENILLVSFSPSSHVLSDLGWNPPKVAFLGWSAIVVNGWARPKVIGGIGLFSVLVVGLGVVLSAFSSLLFLVSFSVGVGVIVTGIEVAKEKPVMGVLTLSWGTLLVRKAGRGGGGSSFSSESTVPRLVSVTLLRNFPPPPLAPIEDNGVEKIFGGGGGPVDDVSMP